MFVNLVLSKLGFVKPNGSAYVVDRFSSKRTRACSFVFSITDARTTVYTKPPVRFGFATVLFSALLTFSDVAVVTARCDSGYCASHSFATFPPPS